MTGRRFFASATTEPTKEMDGAMGVTPHEIVWDKERIAAFWNHLGTSTALENSYFGKQRGRAVLGFVRKHIAVEGGVVDLGCGPGHFLEHLLAAGIACSGADLSADSVAALNRRLGGNPLFQEARVCPSPGEVPFPPASVDVLFCLETVEHLLDADLPTYLGAMIEALAPGGKLIVTVPFREDLERGKVVCGACGCRFHRTQHVRSFTEASLRELFARRGLATRLCRAVILWPDVRLYLGYLRGAARDYRLGCPECGASCRCERTLWRGLWDKLRKRQLRHLVYIGEKPQGQ